MSTTATILRDVPLAARTTLGLGGPARELVVAADEATLVATVREADARAVPVLLLGGGSNLVVADAGFAGRVVQVATRGIATARAGGKVLVRAQAGEPWDDLVARCVAEDLAGLECLSGIPGLAGATPIQNVGAYGQEVGATLVEVRAWDRVSGVETRLDAACCHFRYRDSLFKSGAPGRYVVLEATFALVPGGAPAVRYADLQRALAGEARPTLAQVRAAVLAQRRTRSMVLDEADPESRSVGSFFTNPVLAADAAQAVEAQARARGLLREGERMPSFPAGEGHVKLAAAWLIERAGFVRGTVAGPVAVSRHHALALVHHGGGSARDLVALARRIRTAVREAFGVEIRPEPVFAGFGVDDPTA